MVLINIFGGITRCDDVAMGLLQAFEQKMCIRDRPPADTMCGALLRYITTPTKDFQPMGANMGLLPAPETRIRDKRQRYLAVAQRAVAAMERYLG